MEAFTDIILPILPSIVLGIAKILAKKLAEVDGITDIERAAIALLEALEGFVNAQTT